MPNSEPTIEQLWERPDLTLSEAARVTGRAPRTIAKWVKAREVRSFVDGKYVRIVTQSIRDRSYRLANEQSPDLEPVSERTPALANGGASRASKPLGETTVNELLEAVLSITNVKYTKLI